jgi:hypothetical protein
MLRPTGVLPKAGQEIKLSTIVRYSTSTKGDEVLSGISLKTIILSFNEHL